MAIAGCILDSILSYYQNKHLQHQSRSEPVRSASSPEGNALEDEIDRLRALMEQTADREQSLTSTKVIEISSMLDSKINEYQYRLRRSR
ncbi:MAG: aspartyl-phosphate phosphatase Spo0E family protein [Paenibacillaceae bacterium]|uniref:aspartyl-phosphate phosphatase Spo0E family protein n=1 Tax=Paenibacillus cymbidii TaxID=1639034 RepID=UPI001081D4E9|nr:aspartyl-phosphate phosphatase Spo0E family protein [Paenibacillus cymbidii]MBO9608110.1 aspartyl-phosphate phosphatase Spo0E family protein [Paenibacillaceae bacterium]